MARRTNQRRDAVFALYQSDLTGRGLDDLLGRSSSPYTRALAHATEDYTDELDVLISRYSEGWTIDRIAPLERAILRTALLEMLHPDIVPADTADPPGGRDQRGGGAREDVRGRAVAGLRERHPRGGPARDEPDCGRGMTDDTAADALDPLVERLERAAEQLRSGDLSPDAAASLVEDCAGLAAQAAAELERRARAAATEPLPGQDTLL